MKFAAMTKWGLRALLLAFFVAGSAACKKKEVVEAAEVEVEVLDPSVLEALVVEEAQLEKIRKGWKAKTYRATRKGLVKGALGLIGAVDGKEAHPLLQNLPEDVQEAIVAAEVGPCEVDRLRICSLMELFQRKAHGSCHGCVGMA